MSEERKAFLAKLKNAGPTVNRDVKTDVKKSLVLKTIPPKERSNQNERLKSFCRGWLGKGNLRLRNLGLRWQRLTQWCQMRVHVGKLWISACQVFMSFDREACSLEASHRTICKGNVPIMTTDFADSTKQRAIGFRSLAENPMNICFTIVLKSGCSEIKRGLCFFTSSSKI